MVLYSPKFKPTLVHPIWFSKEIDEEEEIIAMEEEYELWLKSFETKITNSLPPIGIKIKVKQNNLVFGEFLQHEDLEDEIIIDIDFSSIDSEESRPET